jgi:hypothetical protein
MRTTMTTMTKMAVTVLIAAAGLSSPEPASADTTAPYVPALVFSHDGSVPPAVQARLAEAVSDVMSRGLIEAVAEVEYGAALVAAPKRRGPAAILLAALRTIDKRMDKAVRGPLAAELGALKPEDLWSLRLVATWLPATPEVLASGLLLDGTAAAGWADLFRVASTEGDAASSEGVAKISPRLLVVAEGSLPSGVTAYQLDRGVYGWLADGNIERFVPMRLDFDVSVGRGGVALSIGAFVKPAMTGQAMHKRESGLVLESVSYQPGPFNPEKPGVLRLEGTRRYVTSGPSTEAPRLRVAFGSLLEGGHFVQCFAESCADFVYKIPTIKAEFDPEAGGLAARLASDVSNVYVLLQDLVIDLSDPNGPRVLAPRSRIPLVLKTESWWSGTHFLVLDETTHVMGFRLYERVVGSAAADGVSEDLRASADAWDAAANRSLDRIAQAVLAWLE